MSKSAKRPKAPSAPQKCSEPVPKVAVLSSHPKPSQQSKSIVLERDGEKRILKKIKLKGPPKGVPPPPKTIPAKPEASTEKAFICTFCKCRLGSQEQLRAHFLKHGSDSRLSKNPDEAAGSRLDGTTIQLIECEWCPETFTTMSKAIEHKYRKHNYDSKNYFCTLCGRLFPLKVALEQHQALEHKNDKEMNVPRLDFICGFCGTAFSSQVAMELHVKTAHNLEKRMMAHPFIPSPSKKVRLNQAGEIISIYYCHLCGSEYMLKFNLLKHIEDHHPYEDRCAVPEDLLKCSTCDSVFYTKKAFDTHNIHHKPEDLYVTSEEHRLNIVARVDQDFDFRRVPSALDKALGAMVSGTESAAALAKKHRTKVKKGSKAASSTATGAGTGSAGKAVAAVLDLNELSAAAVASGGSTAGLEALQKLLGE